jgi:fructokinase
MRLCIETGGTSIRLGVFDKQAGDERPRDFHVIPNTTFDEVKEKCLEYALKHEGKIQSIGVSSFGPICLDKSSKAYGCLLSVPNKAKESWLNRSLVGEVAEGLKLPIQCTFTNTDVTGSALGELIYGPNERKDGTLAYVTIGTGVGIGAVVDGKPIKGKLHPEGGHILIIKDKREEAYPHFQGKCTYHDSCLENFIGIHSIAERLKVGIHELKDVPDDDQVWDVVANYIGQLCLTLTYVLSPHLIIIGGGIMERPQVLAAARGYFAGYNRDYVQVGPLELYIQKAAVEFNGIHGAAHLSD